MVKQTIQIFARIKPTKAHNAGDYQIAGHDDGSTIISFRLPHDSREGYVNNKKEHYRFKFMKVFEQNSKQDEIFDSVAKPVARNVLEGYNGTIFAYGQTGSGKTFTITGGVERYDDRGIIPRTLSYIFDYFSKHSELNFTAHVSYLEIYNENGYDLLNPHHEATRLEDLPKVSLQEDASQNVHLKNLSCLQASDEEAALNLLFTGDTNRMIAETPMNQASTRSHCIFTIHVSSQEPGSATLRRSKLHLVDLAGSERVGKTGVGGHQLTEAKYINLSLHYLEQVIVCLSEKSRQHIPYRNSMMTSVLRDSLGGNCMTTMIATCSVDKKNIDESISTSRFAQRVALIKNDALLNEELDPQLMISKLQKQVSQLKGELNLVAGEQRTDQLSEAERASCHAAVDAFLEDSDPNSTLDYDSDLRKVDVSFAYTKARYRSLQSSVEQLPRQSYLAGNDKVGNLKELIEQRDNEIAILVKMLKKEKSSKGSLSAGRSDHSEVPFVGDLPAKERHVQAIVENLSVGRQEAFRVFCEGHHGGGALIGEQKRRLKAKYREAKETSAMINEITKKINRMKASLEQTRVSQLLNGKEGTDDEREEEFRRMLECEKSKYAEKFSHLKTLKVEIEHLQHLLEKAKVQVMKDFDDWWHQQKDGGIVSGAEDVVERGNSVDLSPRQRSNAKTKEVAPELQGNGWLVDVDGPPAISSRNIQRAWMSPSPQLSARSGTGSVSTEREIPMTGDPEADAEIRAFVRARKNILKSQSNRK